MPPRRASRSRSPARRTTRKSEKVIRAEKVEKDGSAPAPTMSGSKSVTRSARKLKPHFLENPLCFATFCELGFASMALILSYVLVLIIQERGCMAHFVCPLLQTLIMKPLGLAGLKGTGLLILPIAMYVFVTYLGLTVATLVTIPVCNGQPIDGANPRQQKSTLTGLPHRLHSAHMNCIESLVLMTITIVMAYKANVPEGIIVDVMTLFVLIRMMYIVCYAMNIPKGRTICFMAGVACCARLIILALLKYL